MHATIAMKYQTGLGMLAPDSHLQCPNGKIGVNSVGESVANHLCCAEIFYDNCVEPTFIRIGSIEIPDVSSLPEPDVLIQTRKGVAVSYSQTQMTE